MYENTEVLYRRNKTFQNMTLLDLKIQRKTEDIVYRYKEMLEHKICRETNFRKVTPIRGRKKDGMGLQLNF